MFIQGMEGTLMELAEAPETRYRYVVWFDYTRRAINGIQEGTLLAIPNFASDATTRRYSVREVSTLLPTYYALQGGISGCPGFVVEAARSASEDWETQDSASTEETTKIWVVAEAFGVSGELLNQTFKFQKGQWLLLSHDATGLEVMPIPIRTPDANVRLASWLRERYASVAREPETSTLIGAKV